MRKNPMPLSGPHWLGKILTNVGDGSFTGEEWWLSDLSGTYAKKDGGQYFGTSNPGWPIDGFAPAVGDLVNVRSGDGVGGLAFELSAAVPGESTDPTAYSFFSDPPSRQTWIRTTVTLTVPLADYLVTAQITMLWSGTGNAYASIARLNHGASPASPLLPLIPSTSSGTPGQFRAITVTQLMRAGFWDDDGSTPTIDFAVYCDGAVAGASVQQVIALRVSP